MRHETHPRPKLVHPFLPCTARINLYRQTLVHQDKDWLTLTKYLFGLPSGRMTDTFAVFDQADVPEGSAETIFVPLGMTTILVLLSADL